MGYYHQVNINYENIAKSEDILLKLNQQNNNKKIVHPDALIQANPSNKANVKNNTKSKNTNSIVAKIQNINLNKFSRKLVSISARASTAKCAKHVRIALQSAGAKIVNHPVAASDWGKTLTDIGYRKIRPSFENPEQGDIYIIHRTKSHSYGHIAGFTGAEWVSDFKQSGHAVYKENVKYEYYRLGS